MFGTQCLSLLAKQWDLKRYMSLKSNFCMSLCESVCKEPTLPSKRGHLLSSKRNSFTKWIDKENCMVLEIDAFPIELAFDNGFPEINFL